MKIDSLDKLESAALQWGMLPFFSNGIRGFSVQEMAAPGYLFGDDGEDCWTWKGPVIGRQEVAYGKFFRRKAGFVSLELLPHFLNYRRQKYPVVEASSDSMILDIINRYEGLTSTELKKIIFGHATSRRSAFELPEVEQEDKKSARSSLESPLQRLQMGGKILIADFQYKLDRHGKPYGWGVAVYSTPEIWFDGLDLAVDTSPEESFNILVDHLNERMPHVSREKIVKLLE